MEERIRNLVEKDRIVECINRLFVGTDDRDWKAVRAYFADAVRFDMTSLSGGEPAVLTPRQITHAWEAGLRPLHAIHHQAGNFLVEVGDGTAKAFCYATASHYRKTASGRDTRTFVGSYDFELEKKDDRWLITMFRFNLKYLDGNLDLDTAD